MADDSFLSLSRLQTEVLESTWRLLVALPGKTRVREDHLANDQVREALDQFLGQPAWLVSSVLEAVLSERGSFTKPVAIPTPAAVAPAIRLEYQIERHYGTASPELVWSGDTGARSCARATRYVIEDLFSAVRHSVLIAGYSFDHAKDLFTPLFRRAEELKSRGEPLPEVRVILDCSRTDRESGDTPLELARRTAQRFRATCWSSTLLEPTIQYYAPSAEREPNGFAKYSMHAKCIVVDGESGLVGSANFSTRGRDNRSLEVGALIRDHHFVQSLLGAWADVEDLLVEVGSL